jgi:hypothetical protein
MPGIRHYFGRYHTGPESPPVCFQNTGYGPALLLGLYWYCSQLGFEARRAVVPWYQISLEIARCTQLDIGDIRRPGIWEPIC